MTVERRTVLMGGAAALTVQGVSPAWAARPKQIIGMAERVVDGDSFVMEDRTSVRLACVQAPLTKLRSRKMDWPFSREAADGLSALVRGRRLQVDFGKRPDDRYGRAVGQVYTLNSAGDPDLWVQAEMVRLGLARVYSWLGETADVNALYALETQARDAGRGLWSHPQYVVRTTDPNPLAQDVDSWQIIQGIVTDTAEVRGRVYLNFGADYKTDFTIAIAKKNVKRFTEFDPRTLIGAEVRIRGWVELINGPMVWIDHPQRFEVLT